MVQCINIALTNLYYISEYTGSSSQGYPSHSNHGLVNNNGAYASNDPAQNNQAMHSPHYSHPNMGMSSQQSQNQHYAQQSQNNYNYGNSGSNHPSMVPGGNQQPYNENQTPYASYHGNSQSQVNVSQHQQAYQNQPGYHENTGYYSNQQRNSAMSGHMSQASQSQGYSNPYTGSYQRSGSMQSGHMSGQGSHSARQMPYGNVPQSQAHHGSGATPIVPRPPPTQIPHNHNSRMHLSRLRHGSSSSPLISPPQHQNNPSQGQVLKSFFFY